MIVAAGGYTLTSLAAHATIPADLLPFAATAAGLVLAAHVAVRRLAPRADGTLLGVAALLNGIGFVVIARLDPELARLQSGWTAMSVGAFVAVLVLVRRVRDLERYRYTFALVGIVALLLPVIPGVGRDQRRPAVGRASARSTSSPARPPRCAGRVPGRLPGREAGAAVGGHPPLRAGHAARPPPPRPPLLAWGFSIIVMVREKDLGSSLLFFAVFLAMIYIATARPAYLVIGGTMFAVGAVLAYMAFGHVQDRVTIWLDPWPDPRRPGLPARAVPLRLRLGGFAGTGLGLGNPEKSPTPPPTSSSPPSARSSASWAPSPSSSST